MVPKIRSEIIGQGKMSFIGLQVISQRMQGSTNIVHQDE